MMSVFKDCFVISVSVLKMTVVELKSPKPTLLLARWIHDHLLPVVSGSQSVAMVANFQRMCGLEADGTVTNQFLHLYFKAASAAGEEIYSLMPLVFWLTFPVAIPFITNFLVLQLVGQLSKDFFMLPRPRSLEYPSCKNPIVKLDRSYDTEYGMPSTHTIAGLLPVATMLILSRHGIPISNTAWGYAFLYFISVALSRLYLGVHSVYDLLGGALLGALGITCLHLYGDMLDMVLYHHVVYAPLCQVLFLLLFVLCYPRSGPWSVSFGTSAQIMGPWLGVAPGLWYVLNMNHALRDVLMQASIVAPRPYVLHIHQFSLWDAGNDFVSGLQSFVATLYETVHSDSSQQELLQGEWVNSGAAYRWGGLNWQTFIGRLLLSFALMGLGKVIFKSIPLVFLTYLQKKNLLVTPTEEQRQDCFGNAVPPHKEYAVEVPVRLVNYSLMGLVCVLLSPYCWQFVNL